MTREEALQVLTLFRAGRQASYGMYHAGIRCTLFYDSDARSFAVREQESGTANEYTHLLSEEEMLRRLEFNFLRGDFS